MKFFSEDLNLLLYLQTFLDYEKGEKVLSYLKSLYVLKLLETEKNWENFYQQLDDWKKKVKFLEIKQEVKSIFSSLEREVQIIEEWGYNFRTPENLRYFSKFKDLVEESITKIVGKIKETKETKDEKREGLEIKQALITLVLAEKLDVKICEIQRELKNIEKIYQQTFKEKIIGEDFSFKPLEEVTKIAVESVIISEDLPGLKARENAWKMLSNIIDFNPIENLDGILITSKELFEEWKDRYEKDIEIEKNITANLKILEVKIPLSKLLGFSLTSSLDRNKSRIFLVL